VNQRTTVQNNGVTLMMKNKIIILNVTCSSR